MRPSSAAALTASGESGLKCAVVDDDDEDDDDDDDEEEEEPRW